MSLVRIIQTVQLFGNNFSSVACKKISSIRVGAESKLPIFFLLRLDEKGNRSFPPLYGYVEG